MDDSSCASDYRENGLPRLQDLTGMQLPESPKRPQLHELDSQVPSRERTIIASDHPRVLEMSSSSSGPPDDVWFPMDPYNNTALRRPYFAFSRFPQNRACQFLPTKDLNPPNSSPSCPPPQTGMILAPIPEPVQGLSSSLGPNSHPPKQETFKKPALDPKPVKKSDRVAKLKNKEASPKKASKRQEKPGARRVDELVTKFDEISAHTAKCDTCNRRNSQGMTRCGGCGWQLCNVCRQHRGGNLDHETFSVRHTEANPMDPNEAGPRSAVSPASTPTRTPSTSRVQTPKTPSPEERAAGILVSMTKVSGEESFNSPSSRKRAHSVVSLPVRTKYPRLHGVSDKPKEGSEGASSVNSSDVRPAGYFDPGDFLRRNPTRNARPPRGRFGEGGHSG